VYQVLGAGRSLKLALLFSNAQLSTGLESGRSAPAVSTVSASSANASGQKGIRDSVANASLLGKTLLPGTQRFDPNLLEGDWYGADDGVRWIGRQAALVLPEPLSGPVLVTMQLIPFLAPGKLDSQRLRIRFGGKIVLEKTLDHQRVYTLSIPLPAGQMGARWRLEIHAPEAAIPAELNAGPDKRLLGVAIRSIRITPLQASPAR